MRYTPKTQWRTNYVCNSHHQLRPEMQEAYLEVVRGETVCVYFVSEGVTRTTFLGGVTRQGVIWAHWFLRKTYANFLSLNAPPDKE